MINWEKTGADIVANIPLKITYKIMRVLKELHDYIQNVRVGSETVYILPRKRLTIRELSILVGALSFTHPDTIEWESDTYQRNIMSAFTRRPCKNAEIKLWWRSNKL